MAALTVMFSRFLTNRTRNRTDRQTDTDRDRQRETERQRQRETETDGDRQTGIDRDRETDKDRETQTQRHRDRDPERNRDKQLLIPFLSEELHENVGLILERGQLTQKTLEQSLGWNSLCPFHQLIHYHVHKF